MHDPVRVDDCMHAYTWHGVAFEKQVRVRVY